MQEQREGFWFVESDDRIGDGWWVLTSKRFRSGSVAEFIDQSRSLLHTSNHVLPLRIHCGSSRADVLDGIGEHIVSARVRDVLLSHRCGNAYFVPCVVYDRSDRRVVADDFFCARLDTGAGPAIRERGYFTIFTAETMRPGPTLDQAVGVHFDHSTWTGLDCFVLPNAPQLIVTRAVVDDLKQLRLDGVRIGDVLDYGEEMRAARIATMGRLRDQPKRP